MLICCVAAIMLRTTTLVNLGLVLPQYFLLGTSVTCDVVLNDWSVYGPLPAPTDADELSHCSALSAVDASAPSVPPFALTSFELTMPVDGFARIDGSWPAGVADFMTTPYLPFALTLIPASRNAGLPLMLIRRLSEKTTSADVSGLPFAKCAFRFSWNVNTLPPFVAFHDETSSGIGCARSPPLYVKSVSKIPRSTIDPVGSNARCGSAVLSVNELSTTSVEPAVRCDVAPKAAVAQPSASNAATETSHHRRRVGV